VNITGDFIYLSDPASTYFENINYDILKAGSFYDTNFMKCNYPEAYLTPTNYLNNISVALSDISMNRTPKSFIYGTDIGNTTYTNIDWSNYFTTNFAFSTWVLYTQGFNWNPDDDNPQYFHGENYTHEILENSDMSKIVYSGFVYIGPHVRKLNITMRNIIFKNINSAFTFFGAFGFSAGPNDSGLLENLQFINCTNLAPYLRTGYFTDVHMNGIIFENVLEASAKAMMMGDMDKLYI